MSTFLFLMSVISLVVSAGVFVDYSKYKSNLDQSYSEVSLESHLFKKNIENFNKVVSINYYDEEGNNRILGTGFYISYKNNIWLITNNHICDSGSYDYSDTSDFMELFYTDNTGMHKIDPDNIIHYPYHDLCVVAKLPKYTKDAFTLRSSPPTKYMTVYSIGHPVGMDRLTQLGQYIQERASYMFSGRPNDACNQGEDGSAYVLEIIELFPGLSREACMFKAISSLTTITGAGGSSGSPVHDINNQLLGVIFSMDTRTANWMNFVSYDKLVDFLNIISK